MSKAKEFINISEASPSYEVKQLKAVLQKALNDLDDITDKSTNVEFNTYNKSVMSTIRGLLDPSKYPILGK